MSGEQENASLQQLNLIHGGFSNENALYLPNIFMSRCWRPEQEGKQLVK